MTFQYVGHDGTTGTVIARVAIVVWVGVVCVSRVAVRSGHHGQTVRQTGHNRLVAVVCITDGRVERTRLSAGQRGDTTRVCTAAERTLQTR